MALNTEHKRHHSTVHSLHVTWQEMIVTTRFCNEELLNK